MIPDANDKFVYVNSDHPKIQAKADELCQGLDDPKARAIRIFEFVRDEILYDIRMDPARSAAA